MWPSKWRLSGVTICQFGFGLMLSSLFHCQKFAVKCSLRNVSKIFFRNFTLDFSTEPFDLYFFFRLWPCGAKDRMGQTGDHHLRTCWNSTHIPLPFKYWQLPCGLFPSLLQKGKLLVKKVQESNQAGSVKAHTDFALEILVSLFEHLVYTISKMLKIENNGYIWVHTAFPFTIFWSIRKDVWNVFRRFTWKQWFQKDLHVLHVVSDLLWSLLLPKMWAEEKKGTVESKTTKRDSSTKKQLVETGFHACNHHVGTSISRTYSVKAHFYRTAFSRFFSEHREHSHDVQERNALFSF